MADAIAYYGEAPKQSFRGYAAELDGEIIALGGVYYQDGLPIAFTEMKPKMRMHRKAIAKGCRMIVRLLDDIGGSVYAIACNAEPTAPYLLAKLGFKPTGLFGPHGETLVRS